MLKPLSLGFLIASSNIVFATNEFSGLIIEGYQNNETFCSAIQLELIGASADALIITSDIYSSDSEGAGTAFRRAKVEISPLTIRQLNIIDETGLRQVMCKTKSREGLAEVTDQKFIGKEGQCSDIVKSIVNHAFASLSSEAQNIAEQKRGETTVDPTIYDQFGGLVWAKPGAFDTVSVDGNGEIHFRSEGLFTPSNPNTAISDEFVDILNVQLKALSTVLPYGTTYADLIALGFVNPKELGTHYCTVPSIEAVQQALLK